MGRRSVLLVMLLAAAGCGSGDPPESPSPGPGGETINGSERLGWDQRASGASELATFQWAIYVDGARAEMADTNCASTSGAAGFPCSGRLPPMAPGAHTLELSTFVQGNPAAESPRSPQFRVTVTGSAPGDAASPAWASGDAGVTGDGIPLALERVADGLQRPSDAAFSPDGRLFIAERAGRIRILGDGELQPAPALVLDEVAPGGGLLAIALAPDFAESRLVFTLSIAGSARRAVFRLARYRELRGVLAQRAVLLETPASIAAGAMRFGPDGMLYVALGGTPQESPTSYAGKILRLLPDGRAPRDRRAGLPAVSSGHVSPRALAWRQDPRLPPSGGRADLTSAPPPLLWIADGTPDGVEWITGMGVDEGSTARATWGLPPSETTSAMAFYDGDALPEFRGDLLIASADAQRLLRIKFGTDPLTPEFSEPLLAEQVGPIRVVLSGPDGAIYFVTDTSVGRIRGK